MGFFLVLIGIVILINGIKKLNTAKEIKRNVEVEAEEVNAEKQDIFKRELVLEKKEKHLNDLKSNIEMLEKKIEDLTSVREDLISEIDGKFDESLITVYPSTVISNIEESSSSEIKNQLSLLKIREKEYVIDEAVNYPTHLTSKEVNALKKKMLIPLDSEVNGLLNKLTLTNVDSTRNRIVKVFDKINRLFKDENAELKKGLLEFKLQELELNYSYLVKVNDEKEQQRAIKEQMIEEEKVRREIEREKKRIEKEERQFSSEITKLLSYMQKTNAEVEKELYADKIKELEAKLKELESVKEDVLQRELNTRAGYVYIISNIGSFGEDIYKIGMTRRLEPMDRVKELSSASVPFEFDVHAMIFSEDAPTLESQLHKHFRQNELNKVNQRKEFFKVSLDEIEKVVLENYNGTVTFTKIAQAEQYRRSLELSTVN
ncbi:DUF4041 domain-containing protein [Enterococcus avium]|uniref:DUF4041 domain-containing protein n=1 Tax=Enterococcus avium TaxID=33945 RepID=UPI003D6AA9FD